MQVAFEAYSRENSIKLVVEMAFLNSYNRTTSCNEYFLFYLCGFTVYRPVNLWLHRQPTANILLVMNLDIC